MGEGDNGLVVVGNGDAVEEISEELVATIELITVIGCKKLIIVSVARFKVAGVGAYAADEVTLTPQSLPI